LIRPGRMIVIGLDGVPIEMLMTLADSGAMPHTKKIIKAGALKRLHSTIPDISSVAWSSIITGRNPGEHGIFGFTDLVKGTYQLRFPNFWDLRARAFWEANGGPSVIINVPSTYPVKPMNGAHISGFVSVNINRAVYPPSLISKLQTMDYRLDVDADKAQNNMRLFLDDVAATLRSNVAAYQYLCGLIKWRSFMLVFTTTDRLLHFLWDAWEDQKHKFHGELVDHFRAIDGVIGEITERIESNDNILLLSDHGFERLEKDIYINRLLGDEGFLKFETGQEILLTNISRETKAFGMDPGRIYINLEGKYPKGSVKADEKQEILDEIKKLFNSLDADGRKVIREIYRKDDIYSGPYIQEGPDLVLMPSPGFNLKGAIDAKKLMGNGIFTGMHSYGNAFLISGNNNIEAELGEESSVIDAGRLIRQTAGNREA